MYSVTQRSPLPLTRRTAKRFLLGIHDRDGQGLRFVHVRFGSEVANHAMRRFGPAAVEQGRFDDIRETRFCNPLLVSGRSLMM